MNAVLSIKSNFAKVDDVVAHDRWFPTQVLGSLDDARPCIPHDQVMTEMDQIIAEAAQRLQSKSA